MRPALPPFIDTMQTNRQRVALHEAGHAVCALLLGKRYGCAIFGRDAEDGGLAGPGNLSTPADARDYAPARLAGMYSADTFQDLLRDATITAAGGVAVNMAGFRKDMCYSTGHDCAMIDAAGYEALSNNAHFYEIEAWHKLVQARARRLIGPVWHKVKDVAAELDRRGSLTADEVRAIFDAP